MKEIEFIGGVAGATSYRRDHWRPENGFKRQQPVDNGWHIGPLTPQTVAHPTPVMVWYDFKSAGFRAAEVKA